MYAMPTALRKVGSNEFGTGSRWKRDERARCSLPIAADDGRQQGSISALSANHQDRWSLSARRSATCENRGVHENLLHHVVVRVVRCADEGRVNSLWRSRCMGLAHDDRGGARRPNGPSRGCTCACIQAGASRTDNATEQLGRTSRPTILRYHQLRHLSTAERAQRRPEDPPARRLPRFSLGAECPPLPTTSQPTLRTRKTAPLRWNSVES